MRDAARPRSQRLFDGMDAVKHVHRVFEFSGSAVLD